MMTAATGRQEHHGLGHTGVGMTSRRKRIGEILLDNGIIDAVQLEAALAHQRRTGCKLGQALIRLGFATETQVVTALSRQLGYDAVDVATLQRTPAVEKATRLIPRELAVRHVLLPIGSDGASISVAMSDPTNLAVVDEIAFRTGRRVKVLLAGDRSIATAIATIYGAQDDRLHGVGRVPMQETAAPSRTAAQQADPSPACRCGRHGSAPEPARVLSALTRVLASKGLVTDVELARELRALLGHEAARSVDPTPDALPLRNVG